MKCGLVPFLPGKAIYRYVYSQFLLLLFTGYTTFNRVDSLKPAVSVLAVKTSATDKWKRTSSCLIKTNVEGEKRSRQTQQHEAVK